MSGGSRTVGIIVPAGEGTTQEEIDLLVRCGYECPLLDLSPRIVQLVQAPWSASRCSATEALAFVRLIGEENTGALRSITRLKGVNFARWLVGFWTETARYDEIPENPEAALLYYRMIEQKRRDEELRARERAILDQDHELTLALLA